MVCDQAQYLLTMSICVRKQINIPEKDVFSFVSMGPRRMLTCWCQLIYFVLYWYHGCRNAQSCQHISNSMQTFCGRNDTVTLEMCQFLRFTNAVILEQLWWTHYYDVIMSPTASQITSLPIVYSIIYSSTDQRKHKISASLAFVRGIHRRPVNSPHKWPVTRKMFPFDDVIMSQSSYDGHRAFNSSCFQSKATRKWSITTCRISHLADQRCQLDYNAVHTHKLS